jgi:hypothetical protein
MTLAELQQLRARCEHLENVIAVAASVLARSSLSREDKEALLKMLREAFHQPPAEPAKEHVECP